jgi:hypothetical protein
MPLKAGKSKAVFSHNVSEMVKAGHPLAQALAASYAKKGEKQIPKKKGKKKNG